VPEDPSAIIWAHSLPWFATVRAVYLLYDTWRPMGYLLATRLAL